MFQITKNSVRMIRGDTGNINLTLQDDAGNVLLPEAYTAIFSLKKSIDDVPYIMQKQFDSGLIRFTHEDTNQLPTGSYIYDIQVELAQDGSIHTIGPNPFVILADVTRE
jgi:hypothetical protein